ncbi:MAG: putative bifunctional UDP-N-acetylmuramoylalanyl-D-glutamate--2,6-diaminopimelate ligase/UDP-N-acetylmuramoyl-tripeptide:D-alanyl-D-alanine ligase [bacterium ADurb.BinA186]|nr:MAG: putative bifunctional UDP-N-acetylmuramoylalanyl-D-glutamate--2,6-diaminopimelate ligase/UDP-N-acetylmuramoyl-tripeptide:D-alanyl-D-alanine ligase [bacterium ADurb.BinA186]
MGLNKNSYNLLQWLGQFLTAPVKAFHKPFPEKLYVVEADCDQPGVGKAMSSLLKAECVVWLSSDRTHSFHYDKLVKSGKFSKVEEAIAYEYGYYVRQDPKKIIANFDNKLIEKECVDKNVESIFLKDCLKYSVSEKGTTFQTKDGEYKFPYLMPEKSFYSVEASIRLMEYLGFDTDSSFTKFEMPPSRSSIFDGIKNTTIIDSSYNANFASVQTILSLVQNIQNPAKWFVFGGMLEQGSVEEEEHKKLIPEIRKAGFNKLILVGKLPSEYILPEFIDIAVFFDEPKDALDYLKKNLEGGELILIKGGRLEGLVEHLLADKKDAVKLCRREEVYAKKRQKIGL